MVIEERTGSKDTIYNECCKIKNKTQDDLEVEIQTERVLTVLDETISKIKIAACLGYLTSDEGSILANYLPMEEVTFIIGSCDLFLDSLPVDTNENRSIISNADTISARFQERSLLMKEKYDVHLMRSIDLIYANSDLVQFVDNWDVEMDQLSTSLIQGMIELKVAAKDKLSTSAADEREKEKTLKNAWKDNLEAKNLIEGLEERLNKQTDELNVQLEVKENLIAMYKEKIEATKAKFNEDIKKRITNSEKEMIKNSKISEEKEIELSQQAKDSTQSYNQSLEQHLAAEKILRAKRLKVEAQLGTWIEKYDKEIGDRQAELEELQGQYDVEKAEMDALQAKLDEQEEEYLELMAEKKEYEDDIFNKKYYDFIINRAARRIQRCWRAYRERKKARRKAAKQRKGKKGKKEPEPEPEPEPEQEPEVDMFGDDMDADEEGAPVEEEPADDKGKKGKGKGKKGKKGKDEKPASGDAPTRQDDLNAAEEIKEDPVPPPPENVD